jgi:hypothetical protein
MLYQFVAILCDEWESDICEYTFNLNVFTLGCILNITLYGHWFYKNFVQLVCNLCIIPTHCKWYFLKFSYFFF